MPHPGNGLGGPALNQIASEVAEDTRGVIKAAVEMVTAGGYPVGHEPVSDVEQYETLSRWKVSGDRRYMEDPDAQDRLAELEGVYGATHVPRMYDQAVQQAQPGLGQGMMP